MNKKPNHERLTKKLQAKKSASGDLQVTVRVDQQNPEPIDVLAKGIIEVSEAMQKLIDGPLKQHTIILLLQDITKLPQRDIKKVLDASTVLKNIYLKAPK